MSMSKYYRHTAEIDITEGEKLIGRLMLDEEKMGKSREEKGSKKSPEQKMVETALFMENFERGSSVHVLVPKNSITKCCQSLPLRYGVHYTCTYLPLSLVQGKSTGYTILLDVFSKDQDIMDMANLIKYGTSSIKSITYNKYSVLIVSNKVRRESILKAMAYAGVTKVKIPEGLEDEDYIYILGSFRSNK